MTQTHASPVDFLFSILVEIIERSSKNIRISMSLTFQSGESIKQALYEELQNILSPNTVVRVSAEGRMKQLEYTEGC